MKNKSYLIGIILMLSGITNVQAAYLITRPKDENHQQTKQCIADIKNRVQEIKSMDLKQLSNVDRKELKQELRGMRKQLHSDPVVIVISGVGLLVLIILLILLL